MKKILLISIAIFLLLIVSYGTYLFLNVKSTMKAIHSPLKIENTTTEITIPTKTPQPISEPKSNLKPVTLLLLGIDQLKDTPGRADTILVLTVNPDSETINMLSIPRDTYTEIVGLNIYDKINHSYAFGGVQMTHATVENLLQLPIDYVVSINMEGFVDLIDTLNGVKVENEIAFSTDLFDFPKGTLELSGEETLDYVRMRYDDPLGDFGRQIRQRLVVESLLNKLSSLNIIWQVPSVLETIRANVETNITYDDMKTFIKSYKPALKNIEQLNFQEGDGRIENDVWYYFPSEKELQTIRTQLQESLQ
ncbi:LCP family protein [Ureibacillus xyleni]|nr:LCP family protein [Ureibacillus xyleni]